MLQANLVALSFIEPELWEIEVYIAGIGILDVFGSCDCELHLDPMTFIYELDPYCLELYIQLYSPERQRIHNNTNVQTINK